MKAIAHREILKFGMVSPFRRNNETIMGTAIANASSLLPVVEVEVAAPAFRG
jgi:hypothetical protein